MTATARCPFLICDLDGTLVDSLPGIESSIRHAAETCFPDRTVPPLRELIGPPVVRILAQIWPDLAPEDLDRALAAFRAHYDTVGYLASEPYPSVGSMLRDLREHGLTLFVLTNKPQRPSRAILIAAGLLDEFAEVVSPDSQAPAFQAKTEGAKYLQAKYQLPVGRTMVIGDGADDLEAAKACGFRFAAAAYGYGSMARPGDLDGLEVVKTFSEVAGLVL